MCHWRDTAAPIIAAVIKEFGDNESELKRRLFDAYPFGRRARYPYKIWCDEVRRQTHKRKAKADDAPKTQATLF